MITHLEVSNANLLKPRMKRGLNMYAEQDIYYVPVMKKRKRVVEKKSKVEGKDKLTTSNDDDDTGSKKKKGFLGLHPQTLGIILVGGIIILIALYLKNKQATAGMGMQTQPQIPHGTPTV